MSHLVLAGLLAFPTFAAFSSCFTRQWQGGYAKVFSVKGVGISVAGTAPELHRNSLFIAPQRFMRMQTKTRSNIMDFLNFISELKG